MGKILVGYIVDEHIGEPLKSPMHLNLKLYGFKIFDTGLMDEVVVKYNDIGNMDVFGLRSDLVSGIFYIELSISNGIKFDRFIGRAGRYGYSIPSIPIFDLDMIRIDCYNSDYIFYSEYTGKGIIIKHCLVYDRANRQIDLEFNGFSMVFSDLRYENFNFSYYNRTDDNIYLDWFSEYGILDLGGLYKYNNICIAYKSGEDALLPSGCKILCPDYGLSTRGKTEYNFKSLVLNPELEFICTRNNSVLHSLCVSKKFYHNIKIVDLDSNDIEEYKDIGKLENRLKTIAKELVFY